MDFEKDMYIDESALDVEWLGQAALALKYGKHLAELNHKLRQAEERKKTVRSELIQQANRNPEQCCDKAKPNANDIEAYYRTHEEYMVCIDELLKIQYEVEYAEVAKNEIAFTRKKALEYLVMLHGQQYFAGPKVPRDLSKEWENKIKDQNAAEKIGKNLRRRRTTEDED